MRIRSSGLVRDRKGVTAVEFALIAPVFFLALLGTLNVALMMFAEMSLEYALFNAARNVEIGSSNTSDQISADICNNATLLFGACASGLSIYGDAVQTRGQFANMAAPNVNPDGSLSSTGVNSGALSQPGFYVVLKVAYRMPYMTSLLGWATGQTAFALSATEMFQNEPFASPNGT